MLQNQLERGNNGLVKSKYITFGVEAENYKTAKPRLERLELDILNNFRKLSVKAEPLDGKARLALMHGIFHIDGQEPFRFDWKLLAPSGLSVKDFIAPSSFAFASSRHFKLGAKYGSVSFLNIIAPELNDRLLADFLEMDSSLVIGMHVKPIDQMSAIKTVKRKQMAQTINFLKENGDMDFDELSRRAEAASEKCSALTEKLKATEARMSEVEELKKQVINYLRTRETFRAYKASGYSKRYLAEHEQEILLHRAAKKHFNDLGLKKLPTVKALQAEYAALLAEKRDAYPAYREARTEMKKLLTYRANAETILGGKECIANTPSKYGHR